MNIYNGNVVLDENGEAWVQLREWFDALNIDYRYQLTPIGGPGPNLYIAQRIEDNRFKIAGGQLQSANLVLNTTLGQHSVVGELSSSNLRLRAGYWSVPCFALQPAAEHWRKRDTDLNWGEVEQFDVDDDGVITVLDILLMIAHFGPCE